MKTIMMTSTVRPRFAISSLLALMMMVTSGASTAFASSENEGFIYGRAHTKSGKTYEGRIRWDDEEAFWGDHFNSTKEDRPFLDDVPRHDRRNRRSIEVFGITIGINSSVGGGRQFIIRFGDIDKIEMTGRDEAIVTLKSGEEYELDGGSNDMGAEISVWDEGMGEIELQWKKIDSIEFLPTPADLEVDVFRLYGTVSTLRGDFTGHIQWDQDECLSTDKLDGEDDDGNLSLDMGKIQSIERRSRRSSRVTMRDGREFVLDGTNDVDDDNRGIFVENPSYGRVLIPWSVFRRVDFERNGSGPSYRDFAPGHLLRGSVTDRDGNTHSGRIVYDLDESESAEMIGGEARDIEYSIPISLIRSVVPVSDDESELTLIDGTKIELEDSADVGEGSDGILVIQLESKEGRPIYVAWEDVARVDFEH